MAPHTSREAAENLSKLGSEVAGAKEKLASDFGELIGDAEELLRATAGYSGAGAAAARARFQERVNELKGSFAERSSYLTERYRRATEEADRYVHHSPWQAIGIAAAVGALIGFLSSGRRSTR